MRPGHGCYVRKVSDNELGMFLRARREAMTPAEAGLPAGSRRRTPGLRRAEVATLAGVSVEYLTRLEQGRDRRPSVQVLSALAETLRLTASERTYAYQLAKAAGTSFNCKGDAAPGRTVRPTVQALLDRLMAKRPEQRYASADELLADLGPLVAAVA